MHMCVITIWHTHVRGCVRSRRSLGVRGMADSEVSEEIESLIQWL